MTEGELLQLTMLGRTDISEQVYFDILRRKTAYLFSACCEVGAIMSGSNAETRRALGGYGLELGISFQIMDDLLDFTSGAEVLGKAAGADLIEGKLTLPLILLRDSDPTITGPLREVMLSGRYDAVSRQYLLEMLQASGSIEASRERARSHARNAIKNLEVLPETEYCVALGELAAFVIERSS
jgi:octaprenyl-diphosphate synthase